MAKLIRRALAKAKREGIASLARSSVPWLIDRVKVALHLEHDAEKINWFTHITELDSRAEVLKSTPIVLSLSPTSRCNARCIMCGKIFSNGEKGFDLEMDALESVSQYINNAKDFRLLASGEPFIAPVFWEILDTISSSHAQAPYIVTHSNGMLCNKVIREKIMQSSLGMISFSLDAATPETYKKIRNGDLNKTIENITQLIEMRNAAGRKKPEIRLNMTMMCENVHEAPFFVRMASAIGVDAVELWPLHEGPGPDWIVTRNGWTFSYEKQLLTHCADKANAAFAEANQVANDLGMTLHWPFGAMRVQKAEPAAATPATPLLDQEQSSAPHTQIKVDVFERANMPIDLLPESAIIARCKIPWEWFIVDTNGDVRICCYMTDIVGNIHRQTPDSIWNGSVYRSMRRAIRHNRIPAVCTSAFCPYVLGARYVE